MAGLLSELSICMLAGSFLSNLAHLAPKPHPQIIISGLDKENEKLKLMNEELRKENGELKEENKKLRKEVKELNGKVDQLEK